jgi:hypothetical protein
MSLRPFLLMVAATAFGCSGSAPNGALREQAVSQRDAAIRDPLDASSADVGPRPSLDAAPMPVLDAGRPDATPTPCKETNLARCATVTASVMDFGPSWPRTAINDGKINTSWYADTDTCRYRSVDNTHECMGVYVELTFSEPVSIQTVKIFGNHDGYSGYDAKQATLTISTRAGDKMIPLANGQPPGDYVFRADTPIELVVRIRYSIEISYTQSGPGLGEIEAYAN